MEGRGITPHILNLDTLPPRKEPRWYSLGGCVGPRVVLETLQKGKYSLPCRDSNKELSILSARVLVTVKY
jgi:hypothetical protein